MQREQRFGFITRTEPTSQVSGMQKEREAGGAELKERRKAGLIIDGWREHVRGLGDSVALVGFSLSGINSLLE